MCREFVEINTAAFPHLIEEIRGMAQGANVPFRLLLLANIQEMYGLCRLNAVTGNSGGHRPRARLGCTINLERTHFVLSKDQYSERNEPFYVCKNIIVSNKPKRLSKSTGHYTLAPGHTAGWVGLGVGGAWRGYI